MNLEEVLDTIDFISNKVNNIKEKNRDNHSLDIKDISDLQRYAETLHSLSELALNIEGLMLLDKER